MLSSLCCLILGCGEETVGEMAGEMMEGGSNQEPAETLSISGSYSDEYNTSHVISAELWTITYEGMEPGLFHITKIDEELSYLIAQNDAQNDYAPEAWSRFDWLVNGEELWYCQSAYEAASAEEAEASVADPSDPSMSGCGGFPWTLLSAQ